MELHTASKITHILYNYNYTQYVKLHTVCELTHGVHNYTVVSFTYNMKKIPLTWFFLHSRRDWRDWQIWGMLAPLPHTALWQVTKIFRTSVTFNICWVVQKTTKDPVFWLQQNTCSTHEFGLIEFIAETLHFHFGFIFLGRYHKDSNPTLDWNSLQHVSISLFYPGNVTTHLKLLNRLF